MRIGIRRRIARFVRALFGGSGSPGDWDEAEGGVERASRGDR